MYKFLGRTGIRVSNVCLGTSTFGDQSHNVGRPNTSDDVAYQLLDKYRELGGNFIDTANVYSYGQSEAIIGNWLSGQRRENIVLCTKIFGPMDKNNPNSGGLSRKNITNAVERSLERLQTSFIDVCMMHNWDTNTPIEDSLRVINDLVKSGKVHHIGVSNFHGWQLQKTIDTCKYMGLENIACVQNEYSLIARQCDLEVNQVCRNEGISLLPWGPLKGGWLSGKIKKTGIPDEDSRIAWATKEGKNSSVTHPLEKFANQDQVWKLLRDLETCAKSHNKSVPQVALRWLIQKEYIASVVVGCRTLAQLEDNMGASSGWELSKEEMEILDESFKLPQNDLYNMQDFFDIAINTVRLPGSLGVYLWGSLRKMNKYLGKTGVQVSNVCLGTSTFGDQCHIVGRPSPSDDVAYQLLDKYTELGGNFIDTANVYSYGQSEAIIGNWLSGQQREKVVLCTKVFRQMDKDNPNSKGLNRKNITNAIERSLERLQTNYIDVYMMHLWDNNTPIEDSLRVFNDLVRSGKVHHIGVSNFQGWQLQKTIDTCKYMGLEKIACVQNEYSLMARQCDLEVNQVCRNEGISLLPWGPLKGGWLSGKIKKTGATDEDSRVAWATKEGESSAVTHPLGKYASQDQVWKLLGELETCAKRHSKNVPQVALRWLIQKEYIASVVVGCRTLAQLEDNMGACSGWELAKEEMETLDEPFRVSQNDLYNMQGFVKD